MERIGYRVAHFWDGATDHGGWTWYQFGAAVILTVTAPAVVVISVIAVAAGTPIYKAYRWIKSKISAIN